MNAHLPPFRLIVAILLALGIFPAAAQDYPTHPIKLIVGFPPGGGVDLVARVIGQEMSKGLRQPIIVENKPGAAGTIGAAIAAKSDPDGYTLLVTPGGHALFGAVFQTLPFDTVDSFTWISNVINVPFFAAVRADSRFHAMADVIAAAREAPETISFGSAGPGSTHHLIGEMLASATGVKFLHVPYRGDAPVINALLGGEVDFAFATPTQVIANVAAGKFRALATTAAARSPYLPEAPPLQETLGLKSFDVRTWFALAGPAGIPAPIVAQLNAQLRKALTSPDVQKSLAAIGGEIDPTTPAAMRERVASELATWTRIVEAAKIPKQ
ncbi:MAG TPA: tripartite tricarboxylate transporter substrate-binding protein [Xanthobacteraceae bacterium]